MAHPGLTTNQIHILIALADRDRHGAAIVRNVLEQTAGRLRLWPATLYRALGDMVESGLITELTGPDHPAGESTQLRFYQATRKGREQLAAEAQRLAILASSAKKRLGLI